MKKYKQLFFHTYRLFKRKRNSLSQDAKNQILTCLKKFETALLDKDKTQSARCAAEAKQLTSRYLSKGPFQSFIDLVVALGFALVVAIAVRQLWFELYEIPTGSMRPTLKEQDRLLVSKTTFGINIPLKVGQLYFDPDLVKRNGIITFTGENMDISDADTRYFYIFPGKKQFVKRLLGKPGDLLYFYGGQIYGIDKDGNEITQELQPSELALIDHVPFLRFEGQLTYPTPPTSNYYSTAIIHQMGQPIALLDATHGGKLLSLKEIHDDEYPSPQDYGSLWGISNFAMARLLSKEEGITENAQPSKDTKLFLELTHHPRLDQLELVRDFNGKLRPGFRYETSLISLDDESIKTLFSHLYTARFHVKNGMVTRYNMGAPEGMPSQMVPRLPNVPDGMYEFYYGKAYKIGWQGLASELPTDHPLYEQTPERLALWFNLGLDFNNLYKPSARSGVRPNRYAYFNNGDFYVMGQPLWKKDTPQLSAWLEKENALAAAGNYLPFIDRGPPSKEEIEQNGLMIPAGQYLALGDNHAMSGDSRVFGFVPAGNLRGAPSLLFWPFGPRFGEPNQPPYPWITGPNVGIWIAFFIVAGIWNFVHRRRTHLPIKDWDA